MTMLLGVLLFPAEGSIAPGSHKRWIIVTTISYPTESIRILANMTDWKVNHLSHSIIYYTVPCQTHTQKQPHSLPDSPMLFVHKHPVSVDVLSNSEAPY